MSPALCLLLASFFPTVARADPGDKPFKLAVSKNNRYLVTADGKPFFYLGDTAWELFHRLDRDEAKTYLENRAKKGFTVIQAVILAEYDGLTRPNRYGHLPLKDKDPAQPVDAYFRHVDDVIAMAEKLGLVVGLLPTWGDKFAKKWGIGPEVFTEKNARTYGEYLGKRYKGRRIIWILGGDRSPEKPEHFAVTRAMAAGIRAGGSDALMTYHPQGGATSATFFHKDDWLAFNMLQSGHNRNVPNYDRVAADYRREPVKPCLDGEPVYEDHPLGFKKENGYADDLDCRKALYWGLFAGACGHTYGCHDIWQFLSDRNKPISHARTPWVKAIDLPGSSQMVHAKTLLLGREYLTRVPDQALIVGDAGKGGDHVRATRDEAGTYALAYLPSGKPVTLAVGKLKGETFASRWFDPRTGKFTEATAFGRADRRTFTPPKAGEDWVLVVEVK